MTKPIRHITGLLFWLVLCYTASFVGAIASFNAKSFYGQLIQPDLAPPPWVFGPVWTVLYGLMAVAVWLVWKNGGFRNQRAAISLFVVQLVLNAIWSWIFFYWQSGLWAFMEIIVLWAALLWTTIQFWKAHQVAGILLIPYLAWVTFASWLTFSLWQLNPQILG